jgi:hypothetical protein
MFVRSLVLAAAAVSLIACASSEPSSSADGESTDQAATAAEPSCGANYGKANDLYKQAVALAKQHKVSACEGANGSDEGAYLSTIAAKASQATSTCGAFSNVIKTSQWAAPIRDELKGTLVLPLLEGDLQIKDASGHTTFKGLDKALPGVTLWGPASGVYGNQKKLEFGANGVVKISTLEWPSQDAKQPLWTTAQGSYTIGAVSGDAIKITIVQGPTTADFELKAVTREWDGSPDFEFQPPGAQDAGDLYTAYISECEA